MMLLQILGVVVAVVATTESLGFLNTLTNVLHNSQNEVNQLHPFAYFGAGADLRRQCPICDSSVYNYCGDKLFHDSCCCHNPNNPYDKLPRECRFADCGFLHANSCREHKLITACCCTGHNNNGYGYNNNGYNNGFNNGYNNGYDNGLYFLRK